MQAMRTLVLTSETELPLTPEVDGGVYRLLFDLSSPTTLMLIQKAGREDVRFRSALKEELFQATFEGVTGKTSFGPDGEVIRDPFILRVLKDRIVLVEKGSVNKVLFEVDEPASSPESP